MAPDTIKNSLLLFISIVVDFGIYELVSNSWDVLGIVRGIFFSIILIFMLIMVICLFTRIALRKYRYENDSEEIYIVFVLCVCMCIYSIVKFLSIFYYDLSDRYFVGYLLMMIVSIGIFLGVLVVFFVRRNIIFFEKYLDEQSLLCPVYYDNKIESIDIMTNKNELVTIPIDYLVPIKLKCFENNSVCVYIKNDADQSIKYKILHFNSRNETELAIDKINSFF